MAERELVPRRELGLALLVGLLLALGLRPLPIRSAPVRFLPVRTPSAAVQKVVEWQHGGPVWDTSPYQDEELRQAEVCGRHARSLNREFFVVPFVFQDAQGKALRHRYVAVIKSTGQVVRGPATLGTLRDQPYGCQPWVKP